MRKKKFRPSTEPVASIWELDAYLRDKRWIYLNDVPKHPSVIENMRLATLQYLIKGKVLKLAIPNKEKDGNGRTREV